MATFNSGPVAVWCNDSASSKFFPMVGPMRFQATKSILWSFRLLGWSADTIEVQPAAQFSKDGLSWESDYHTLDSGYSSPTGASQENWFYSDQFKTIDNATYGVYRYVRYGLLARAESGGNRECVRGQLFIETRR